MNANKLNIGTCDDEKNSQLTYTQCKPRHYTGIDRLEIGLSHPIDCEEFRRNARLQGLEPDIGRLSGGWRLSVKELSHIHLHLWNWSSKTSRKVICNPTYSQNFDELQEHLNILLGKHFSPNLKLIRQDYAVNIPCRFKDVQKGFVAKYKRKVRTFTSGDPTGFEVGSKESQFVVYDYDAKHKPDDPRNETRIEARFTGRKQPARYFGDLEGIPSILEDPENCFFKTIQVNRVQFTSPRTLTNLEAYKVGKLESACDINGFGFAKSYLNSNGNFLRDYRKLFHIVGDQYNLDEVLKTHLNNYFNTDNS